MQHIKKDKAMPTNGLESPSENNLCVVTLPKGNKFSYSTDNQQIGRQLWAGLDQPPTS